MPRKPGGKSNILTISPDGKRDLIFVNYDCGSLCFMINLDAFQFCRAKRSCDEYGGIITVIDNIDVLVIQFTNNGMDTNTLHSHTGSYGVDTVVMRFDRNFRPLPGFTRNGFNFDNPVKNFGDFYFKQFCQIFWIGT